MKTTLILPDDLVRKVKSRAALDGLTLSRYVERCLDHSLREDKPEKVGDWVYALPKVPQAVVKEVNDIISNEGFDHIDPEMWT